MAEVEKVEIGYDNESIRALKGAERVRLRPEVMLGSRGTDGAFHTFQEILGNAIDEVQAKACDEIHVTFHKDGGFTVRDFGRGVPMDWNANENKYNWQLIFDDLYAGGKYDDSAYKSSLGLNGVGACATQYSSQYTRVLSIRDGFVYKMSFEKGYPVGELEKNENTEGIANGTAITWRPDEEVFGPYKITWSAIRNYCIGQAHISRIKIVLCNENTGETEEVQGQGIGHMLKEAVPAAIVVSEGEGVTSGQTVAGKDYTAEIEYVLAINPDERPFARFFHNTTEMQGGRHLAGYEGALTAFFKKVAQDKQWGKVQENDYKGFFCFITSTHSTTTSFANQTKNYVNDEFIYRLVYDKVYNTLVDMYNRDNEYLQDIFQSIEVNINARIKAREMQETIKAAGKLVTKSGKKRDPEKFCGCREKDPKKRELYIVEGDSALLACKNSRNSNFQALMPVRGKTLNCLKVDTLKALASQIIADLVSIIGTGVDVVDDNHSTFNIDNLQFDKIIFCTDADEDGFQIRVLLYTIFYRLMPRLLEEGHVYIVESPLFEMEMSNGKSIFAYSIPERDKLIAKYAAKGIATKRVHRSKGLGENDPEMMSLTTMSPDTRRLTQLKINPRDEAVAAITDMLFGADSAHLRKQFIMDALGNNVSDIVSNDFDVMSLISEHAKEVEEDD